MATPSESEHWNLQVPDLPEDVIRAVQGMNDGPWVSAKPPIGPATEKYVRYTATVPLLEVAWQFVMQHVDEFAEPRIEIAPHRVREAAALEGEQWTLEFEVTVGGLVND